jgi:putative Mg2+ transporter-C (MgtC) family protein
MFNNPQYQMFFQLFLAALLGAIVGLEREYKRKEAGLRTYSLVSLASAFFTMISFSAFFSLNQTSVNFDPSRIIGQIVLGVGFLGAGLIIYRQTHVEGLTTAAGLWLVSAVGAAVGVKLYALAIFVALLGVGILSGLRLVEEKVFGKKPE